MVREEVRNLDLPADQIVLAAGFETTRFPGCEKLPLKATIGQSLVCRCQDPLPFSLVSQGHITPTEDPALCQVGSTYEHTDEADPKKALELLEIQSEGKKRMDARAFLNGFTLQEEETLS